MNTDIFNIAKSLFYENGYSKTKISDITGKLGLVPANFYRYYDSKEDLLKKIISHETKDYIVLLEGFPNEESFHEKLESIFKINLKFLFEKPYLFALLMEIKTAKYKLEKPTINLANSINTKTIKSINIILDHSILDSFTKRVTSSILIDNLNIFLNSLIKDSNEDICPTRVLTKDFNEEFDSLFKLIKSICYGLGVSNNSFSRLDEVTGILKEDFFLEFLTNSYNCITNQKSNIDILYITVSGYEKKKTNFFSKNILQSIGVWLNSSFRNSDQAGLIGDNNFALLLSKHSQSSSSLLLERCLEFEASLQEKYPTLNNLTLNARILQIEEGNSIDFKEFFHSEETIEKHTLNKTKYPIKTLQK